MKKVRINHEQYARWRNNRGVLVNDQGAFVRYATEAETDAEFRAQKRGVVVKVLHEGQKLSFSTDRELLKKELLAKHGPCRLAMFNNVILSTITDGTPRVSAKPPEGKTQVSPEHCSCASWGGRQAGRHHPTCQYNRHALPEHQGFAPEQVIETIPADVEALNKKVREDTPATMHQAFIPSPEECNCRSWAKPGNSNPNLHHPTCEHFDAWNLRAHPSMMLCHADGTEIRPATTEEVETAERNRQARGVPSVVYDRAEYYVLEKRTDALVDVLPDVEQWEDDGGLAVAVVATSSNPQGV